MDFDQLIVCLQAFYKNCTEKEHPGGEKYNEIHMRAIKQWLDKNGISYTEAFAAITLTHSTNWRSLPDVAKFAEAFAEKRTASIESEARDQWNLLRRRASILNNIICEDIRTQQVIESWGGWISFCERNPEYEELHKKEFVKRFKQFTDYPQQDPPVLLKAMYDVADTIAIGNHEKCKQLLQSAKASPLIDYAKNMRITFTPEELEPYYDKVQII